MPGHPEGSIKAASGYCRVWFVDTSSVDLPRPAFDLLCDAGAAAEITDLQFDP